MDRGDTARRAFQLGRRRNTDHCSHTRRNEKSYRMRAGGIEREGERRNDAQRNTTYGLGIEMRTASFSIGESNE